MQTSSIEEDFITLGSPEDYEDCYINAENARKYLETKA